ncbi:hypothetical protein OEIGOIKO_05783 [Streptomyces chrestomyceticus JCM 4735]|uniref:Pycsar effector protein domain-containing protein n=1 Tax=Streptomyces chrestomyceticus JCM 4735 TaxID=1306181 RepID=A0A7U9PZZ5_9ACTN|nr:Pycsar system effector family protein [Streptomyces chrestomyceticus]GCD37973.1 hypothetical protein OEIGOIKO_05783 [Streptomyces chrestomyceticus JCM 4735]
MTTVTPPTGSIETRIAEVRSDIARADSKAGVFFAALVFAAGALADNVSALVHRGWATGVPAVATTVLVGAAAWLLLDVVLPRTGAGRAYFAHYARCDDEELDAALTASDLRAELRSLSRICDAKMRLLTRAGRLLKAAGLAAAVTVVPAIGGWS